MTLITDLFPPPGGAARRVRGRRDGPRTRRLRASLRPARLDVLQRRGGVLLAADPRDHALPEAARADRAGHLVGTVEPEDGRLVRQPGHRAGGVVGVLAHVEGLVRRDVAALLG